MTLVHVQGSPTQSEGVEVTLGLIIDTTVMRANICGILLSLEGLFLTAEPLLAFEETETYP